MIEGQKAVHRLFRTSGGKPPVAPEIIQERARGCHHQCPPPFFPSRGENRFPFRLDSAVRRCEDTIVREAAIPDSPESKKAVFRKLVDLYAAGDVSSLDQLLAPDYVGHVAAGDRDLEGFRQSILFFHDLFVYTMNSFRIEDQLVDGEKVVTRMTADVKVRETGEPVRLMGINIARIVDGKLVEEWNTWEQMKAANS